MCIFIYFDTKALYHRRRKIFKKDDKYGQAEHRYKIFIFNVEENYQSLAKVDIISNSNHMY